VLLLCAKLVMLVCSMPFLVVLLYSKPLSVILLLGCCVALLWKFPLTELSSYSGGKDSRTKDNSSGKASGMSTIRIPLTVLFVDLIADDSAVSVEG